MQDQAKALRGLMEHRSQAQAERSARIGANYDKRTVAITSGKGGVGKSNVALNLAIALAQTGKSTLLIDANLGVGSLPLLSGLNSPWNLSHVVDGELSLGEILIEGPKGIAILPGAGSLGQAAHDLSILDEAFEQLAELKGRYQFTILDLGAGLERLMDRLVTPADRAIMVTTTEPTSLAEAYAAIKSRSKSESLAWEALINQASSGIEAGAVFERLSHTTRAFLQKDLGFAGWIPLDPHIPKAVRARSPFVIEHAHSAAAVAIKHLTRRLIDVEADSHTIASNSHSHITRQSPRVSQHTLEAVAAH